MEHVLGRNAVIAPGSMDTYLLPPEMGGGECTIEDSRTDLPWPNHRVVKIPSETVGAWYVLVPKDALTEVRPKPEEPPLWSLRLVRALDKDRSFDCPFIRTFTGWYGATFGTTCYTWDELLELDPEPQPLVQVAEPVTLPWTVTTEDDDVHGVDLHDDGSRVSVWGTDSYLTPDAADAMAAALTTAAAEARQAAALLTDVEKVGGPRVLIAVPSPLPVEPADLGWYLATIGEAEQLIRKVEADGWSVGRNSGLLSSWKTLNEDFPGTTLVRLVPAPEPVTLPWVFGPRENYVRIDNNQRGKVRVFVVDGDTSAGIWVDARQMIAALTAAADEADRRSDG